MYFKQLIDQEGCFSYIIGCGKTGEAVVVDACHNTGLFLDTLQEQKLKLKYLVETHTHADHDTVAGELVRKTGAPVAMHRNYAGQRLLGANFTDNREVAAHLAFNSTLAVDIELEHGSVLQAGDVAIRVLHCPGHTTDSICLELPERLLITGDSLMIGQCGRPDLPGGDSGALFDSMFGVLLKLDDNTIVCPGHDYNGNVSSTIGYERVNNPFLKNRSREEFVAYAGKVYSGVTGGGKLQCSVKPPEDASLEDKKLSPMGSQMCSAIEYYIGNVPSDWNLMDAGELKQYLEGNSDVFLLDVRTPEEFASGRIKDSVNIPLSELPARVKELPGDLERPLVAICQSGARSAYALMFLRGYGYAHVRSLDLGLHHWKELGYLLAGGAVRA